MMNYSSSPVEEIPQGTTVNDVSKEKVGTVIFSALRDGFFVVEKGWLFTHQLYLPSTAILAHDADGLTLRLSKEELKDEKWKQPPDGDMNEVATPVYPNSPLPASENPGMSALASAPLEEERDSVIPSDDVRPLADDVIPPTPLDAVSAAVIPSDDVRPLADDVIPPRPTEEASAAVIPSDDVRPLTEDVIPVILPDEETTSTNR